MKSGFLALALACAGSSRADKDKDGKDQAEVALRAVEKAISAMDGRPTKDGRPPRAASSSVAARLDDRPLGSEKSFSNLPVANRGLAGSQIADSTHFAPRIHPALQSRKDESSSTPATTTSLLASPGGGAPTTFVAFAKAVHDKLPKTKILFLWVKPSVARWKLIDKARKANGLIEAECKKDERLTYWTSAEGMLDKEGKPKPELFVKTGCTSAGGHADNDATARRRSRGEDRSRRGDEKKKFLARRKDAKEEEDKPLLGLLFLSSFASCAFGETLFSSPRLLS